MRRKIAFGITVAMTVLLAVLNLELFPGLSLFGMNVHALSILLICLTLVAVAALCFTKSVPLTEPHGKWFSICGWMSTFCGAVMTMTVVLDLFFLLIYGEMPAPGIYPTGGFDYFLLYGTLALGIAGGIYLVLQGFRWMASKADCPVWLRWLALCPVLWMWFRLARYEISYASTLDIEENFFTFGALVFASLFFLQFARAIAHIGKEPKSSLPIFALMTALVTLSAAPASIARQAVGEPIGSMLIVVVDAVIGLTALFYAAMQVFSPAEAVKKAPTASAVSHSQSTPDEEYADELSWGLPSKAQEPVEPPFSMDKMLPTLDIKPVEPARYPRSEATPTEAPKPVETAADVPASVSAPTPTVDELLNEIDTF